MEQTKIKIPGLFKQISDKIQFYGFILFFLFMLLNMYAVYPITLILAYYYPPSIAVSVAYMLWLVWDRKTPYTGGRKSRSSLRYAKVFQTFRDYFPIHLVKTTELPNDRNYLFTFYPHGTLPISVPLNFLTNCNDIDSVYPGIDFQAASLNSALRVPFLREMYLELGVISCSESSIKFALNQPPSKAVVIVAGGAAEMNLCKPGNEYQILKTHRKGFVRVALQTGASLVPVFTFGENKVFTIHKLLNTTFFKRTLGLDLFMINGRGFFQDRFGLLPRKVPINQIVGKPIHVPKVENPTQELIDEYHEKFFQELYQLFEKYKHQYDNMNGTSKLIMI